MSCIKLLTFEMDPQGDRLEIHVNQEGLNDFIRHLEDLKNPHNDPIHLMTPDWGGRELSKEKQDREKRRGTLVNHSMRRLNRTWKSERSCYFDSI